MMFDECSKTCGLRVHPGKEAFAGQGGEIVGAAALLFQSVVQCFELAKAALDLKQSCILGERCARAEVTVEMTPASNFHYCGPQ
jgi:hypothetical protein